MRTLACSLGGFCFCTKLKTVSPQGLPFTTGTESHYKGQWGWRGRRKANLTQSDIQGEAQPLSLNPSMGCGEEQDEVSRSAALQ